MASIPLHSDCPEAMTSVSNYFIDNYMPEANGEFVKVYIYLLRCMNAASPMISISQIADTFEHTEADIIRALKYWEKVQLLHIEYDDQKKICGLCLKAVPKKEVETVTLSYERVESTAVEPTVSKEEKEATKKEYTPDEIKEFQKDEDISELFFIIETYLKHPLSSNDINTILYWHESLHFSTELIVYLVEYCISKGHSSLRYMDKVAMGWNDSHITTVEQAKENSIAHSQVYYAVMKALGISGRNLVDSEIAFIQKWTKEYLFEMDIIQEACKRTIAKTHQPSFEYTDSILSSWNKNHVHNMNDIVQLDATYNKTKRNNTNNSTPTGKNKFNNFNQRNYDYDQLEKVLLTTSVN